jgi:hypothetical protein
MSGMFRFKRRSIEMSWNYDVGERGGDEGGISRGDIEGGYRGHPACRNGIGLRRRRLRRRFKEKEEDEVEGGKGGLPWHHRRL